MHDTRVSLRDFALFFRVCLGPCAVAFALMVMQARLVFADPLLFDNFDAGYADWSVSGNVVADDLHVLVANSVRLRGPGSITRAISTLGYDSVSVSGFLAARLLETTDSCLFEVSTDGGASYSSLINLSDGDDDGDFRWVEQALPAYANNPNLILRYRNASNALSDNCYAEDVAVSGFAIGLPACDAATVPNSGGQNNYDQYVVNFDPLNGLGLAARTQLTSTVLNSGPAPSSLVASSAFAMPADAAPPLHQFEGRLELFAEASSGSFSELLDDFAYTGNGDDPRKHLPEFNSEFVQTGSHIIPVQRGIVLASHPYWEFILEPGRIWSEVGDNGWSRIAMPFSLQQRNSNCVHNGLLTFLFDGSQVSKVAYQIASETCAYYQFNMWGLLDAQYTPSTVVNALSLKGSHQEQLAGRMPQKPIAALAVDYPSIDPDEFGHSSEVAANDMTVYGVVFGGVHYVAGCATRAGAHPYCDSLRLPSYSTAKTTFAGAASMRLEYRYPGFLSESLVDWIPAAAADPQSDWSGVSVEHALDMATGNFRLSGYIADESSVSTNDFFLPETHAEKLDYSVSRYPRSATPGTQMHYHTTDTYLATTAAQRFLREQEGWCADVFDDVVVGDMWTPLGLDVGSKTTRRTYDPVKQPFGGYGLSYVRDDVAKLAVFLGVDHGRINGLQVLAPEALAAAKFSDPSDLGLPWSELGNYNTSFWGQDKTAEAGCSTMVPYLSGYGGITVAITAGGVVYYYFSDGNSFTWDRAFSQAESLQSSCNTTPPQPPTLLVAPVVNPLEVVLRWTPAEAAIGVIRYRIYRNGVLIATTSGNEWSDTGLALGDTAEYRVESVDAAGNVSPTSAMLLVGQSPIDVPLVAPLFGLLGFAALLLTGVAQRYGRARS